MNSWSASLFISLCICCGCNSPVTVPDDDTYFSDDDSRYNDDDSRYDDDTYDDDTYDDEDWCALSGDQSWYYAILDCDWEDQVLPFDTTSVWCWDPWVPWVETSTCEYVYDTFFDALNVGAVWSTCEILSITDLFFALLPTDPSWEGCGWTVEFGVEIP